MMNPDKGKNQERKKTVNIILRSRYKTLYECSVSATNDKDSAKNEKNAENPHKRNSDYRIAAHRSMSKALLSLSSDLKTVKTQVCKFIRDRSISRPFRRDSTWQRGRR